MPIHFHAETFHAETFHAETFHADTFHADTFHGDTFHADTFYAETFSCRNILMPKHFHAETFHADVVHGMPVAAETTSLRRRGPQSWKCRFHLYDILKFVWNHFPSGADMRTKKYGRASHRPSRRRPTAFS